MTRHRDREAQAAAYAREALPPNAGCTGVAGENKPTMTIPLTHGLSALVDADDYEHLSQWRWYASRISPTGLFYVMRGDRYGPHGVVKMHRVLMGLLPFDGLKVDHINHDTMDNRRCNLRIVTTRGNNENRRNRSRFGPGVRWRHGRYAVTVWYKGERIDLGKFVSLEDATESRRKFLAERGEVLILQEPAVAE